MRDSVSDPCGLGGFVLLYLVGIYVDYMFGLCLMYILQDLH